MWSTHIILPYSRLHARYVIVCDVHPDVSHSFLTKILHEYVVGVPVPYKRDQSLITWDRSQIVECFGTGPITLFIEQFFGGNHIFWINFVLFRL